MGFRFRKSFKVAPGVRLNMGRTGFTSMSLGPRGLKMNVGSRGVRTTVGLPGTGISYTTSTTTRAPSKSAAKAPTVVHVRVPTTTATAVSAPRKQNSHKVWKTFGALLLALLAVAIHPLVGLLVGLVLLWLIWHSGKPKPAVLLARAPDSAQVPPEPPTAEVAEPLPIDPPQPVPALAPSDMRLERLRLTAVTKLASDASGGSKRVGQLAAGCDVTVLSRRPGWMFVQADSGDEGWARDQNWTPLPR